MLERSLKIEPDVNSDDDEFIELDNHIRNLIAKNHPRIMNLEIQIPYNYHWENFLNKHFADPPFTITREDYEYHIVGKTKTKKVKDSRQPTTFYSLLRFIEYFRKSLLILENNLKQIEAHYERLKNTARDRTSVRGLLLNMSWSYESISNKHNIYQKSFNQKESLEGMMGTIEPLLADNLNITSRWMHLLKPMYLQVIKHINNNFVEGAFNLRMFYPLKTLSAHMAPYYTDAMSFAVDLNEGLYQTTLFIKNNYKTNT